MATLSKEAVVTMWRENNGRVSGRASLTLEEIMEGIGSVNEVASERLIGNDAILQGIDYKVVGHEDGNCVVVEVSGYIDEADLVSFGYLEEGQA